MKIETWNVRGFNKIFKHKEYLKVRNNVHFDIIAIIEHRVSLDNVSNIIKKIAFGCHWKHNYNTDGRGRIWLLWNPTNVNVTVLQTTNQFIHCMAETVNGCLRLEFTAIYSLHTIEDRKGLWSGLEAMAPPICNPWLIMGDFNAILKGEDRIGRPVIDAETKDFAHFLDNYGVTELKIVGRFFTWTNIHVHSKIDIALVNANWLNKWTQLEAVAHDPYFSDHSLLTVTIEEYHGRQATPFKFLNCLAGHQDFNTIIEDIWSVHVQGSHTERVWKMKKLNTKEFSKVEFKVRSARQQLHDIQLQLRTTFDDPQLYDREKALKGELEKWSMIEESIMKQNVKNRISTNHINRLVSENGTIVQDAEGIEKEVVAFYSKLFGSREDSLKAIDPRVMSNGPKLDRAQQLKLVEPISTEEIVEGLQGI
ncbi:uncharacterized protein LOC132612156 [Lycium barbarum]|uniref:uncharacterized protein LOC132612156 n=1 Tax=Lycium barbarum TaxID=112863 RepID=UPI00293E7889|nr:uncharacterized protein LOC132612156 [Lycium barbarum]